MPLSIYRAAELPSNPADRHKNTIYLVKAEGSTTIDSYVVDALGTAYTIFDDTRFNALFDQYSKSLKNFYIVETIEERDNLNLTETVLVYVVDASGDATVDEGGALYFYAKNTGVYTKILQTTAVGWDSISGRPQSSPDDIDASVGKAHDHENKETLDSLSAVGDILYFKEKPVTHMLLGKAEW